MSAARCAALYVRADTVYKQIAGVDCWDIDRDARGFDGPLPVVAHPPCRAWGRLRGMAKPRHDEKALGFHAVDCVRRFGGVLEHPAYSLLWDESGMPKPGYGVDAFGGWTFPVMQQWFGHRAPKSTWLYVVGCNPKDLPGYGIILGLAAGRVELMGRAERERTPKKFAEWLVDLASRCKL